MSYDSADKVLFSADGFGKFGALDVDEEWDCEARRYYFGIVGKYGAQVQAVLKKAAGETQPLQDAFLQAITPELVFMNGAADVMNGAKKYLDKHDVPYILGYKGLTRMRTDGRIWMVDYLYEPNPDREIINPAYVTTTDVP